MHDSFADRLFPGTSTIQTRLRYMLFVPWIYRDLERARVPTAAFAQRTDGAERSLIDAMRGMDDREVRHLDRLKRGLGLYRLVFGQPRQEDLLAYLAEHLPTDDLDRQVDRLRINLEPPGRSRNLQHKENE